MKGENLHVRINQNVINNVPFSWYDPTTLTNRQTDVCLISYRNTWKAPVLPPHKHEIANSINMQNRISRWCGLVLDNYHVFITQIFMTNQYKKPGIKIQKIWTFFLYCLGNILAWNFGHFFPRQNWRVCWT